jgi:hypothetical protein
MCGGSCFRLGIERRPALGKEAVYVRFVPKADLRAAAKTPLFEAIQQGRSSVVAETTLEALEASLRAFERRRRLLLDRLKER